MGSLNAPSIDCSLKNRMARKYTIVRIGRWFIGLAILAYLLFVIDPRVLWASLVRADWRLIPMWVLVYSVAQGLGTLKIYLLFQPVRPIRYWTLLRYDVVATSLGYFTPAQVGGPISLLLSLRQQSIEFSRSVSVLVVDKAVTLCVTSALGAIGVYQAVCAVAPLGDVSAPSFAVKHLAFYTLMVVGLTCLSKKNQVFGTTFWSRFRHVKEGIWLYRNHWRYVLLNVAATFGVQACSALSWVVCLRAIGKSVGFVAMITTAPALAVIGFVPISISGLGTQELGAIALWKPVGVSAADALAAFVLARALVYTLALVLLSVNSFFGRRSLSDLRKTSET
jgi:uncharacterized protein (TIRG00374 family)